MIELSEAYKRTKTLALTLTAFVSFQSQIIALEVIAQGDPPTSSEVQNCTELQRLVERTYDFRVADLTEEQQRQKSEEDNAFGRFVRANPAGTMPCLAAALRSPSANRYFLYSGSTLLYSMDRSEATKRLLISSLARTDLTEISFPFWLELILAHSLEGFDTSAAVENWLRDTRTSYQISRRGPLLDRKQAFFHLIGSIDEKFATPLLAKIGSENDNPLRIAALDLLVLQETPEARSAALKIDLSGLSQLDAARIRRRIAEPPTVLSSAPDPKFDRNALINALTSGVAGKWDTLNTNYANRAMDWENVAVTVLSKDDVPLLRKVRRAKAVDLNPGSKLWYERISKVLVYASRK